MTASIESLIEERMAPWQRDFQASLQLETCASDLHCYRRLLEALFGFYAPMEERLDPVPWHQFGLDFEARKKTRWLKRDLVNCGADPEQVERCFDLPPIETLSDAFGALYAMESMTLRGADLAKVLHHEGMPIDLTHFFCCYGRGVNERWSNLITALESVARSSGDAEAMIRSAWHTFDSMKAWLCNEVPELMQSGPAMKSEDDHPS